MSTAVKSVKPLTRSALALPPKSRARLAETLLASLDDPRQKVIDAAWATEAEDRMRACKAGKMAVIPGEEVFRALKSKKRS